MNAALVNKLRLSLDMRALILEPPSPEYLEELSVSGEAVAYDAKLAGTYGFVLLFAASIADLNEHAPTVMEAAADEAMVWICYPKGTSRIKTDLNRDRGWNVLKAAGWEGVALVSLDDTWTAMRFRSPVKPKSSKRSAKKKNVPAPVKEQPPGDKQE